MNFQQLIPLLSDQLSKPLPGRPVQLLMSSILRVRELMDFSNENHATKSSVLILLYPEMDSVMMVVTQRPEYDGVHSGQISLPGGRSEPTDTDARYTALRETHEEIGVPPDKIRVIGQLTELYIPPSNYLVQPFVGYLNEKPVFIPHPKEVREIIEIPLMELMDEGNRKKRRINVRGMRITAPCYIVRNVTIWGATAMILSEFREVVRRALDQK